MARTLARAADRGEIAGRIAALMPDARRRWGSMSVGGMLCHVDDSYRGVMGERPLDALTPPMPKGLMKFAALRLPMQWPRGLMTAESVRQGGGGTPPAEFAADRARLLATLSRFCACAAPAATHPFFGRMSGADWLRWGWLHADHHLRQFGA